MLTWQYAFTQARCGAPAQRIAPCSQDSPSAAGPQYTWTVRRIPSGGDLGAQGAEGRRMSNFGMGGEQSMEMPHDVMTGVVADAVQGVSVLLRRAAVLV